MPRRVIRLVAAVAVAAAIQGASMAAAQEPATLILKSGERVSGDLIDMGGRDFTMATSAGERRILVGEVAVIDFTGGRPLPAGEASRAGSGPHLLVLRSGQALSGQLDDVGGTRPLRITFKSPAAADYRSSDVLRIYLGAPPADAIERPGDTVTAQPVAGDQADGLAINANQLWTRTGLLVRSGQTVRLTTTGRIRISQNPDDTCGPAGREGRLAAAAPIPASLVGALIGRVGNGPAFGVGDQASFPAPGTGELWLGINDDNVADNAGAFRVTLAVVPLRRR